MRYHVEAVLTRKGLLNGLSLAALLAATLGPISSGVARVEEQDDGSVMIDELDPEVDLEDEMIQADLVLKGLIRQGFLREFNIEEIPADD